MLLLDRLDQKIIHLVSRRELHPSEIGRRLGLPRTTIQYRLKKIAELGLARERVSGRKTLWSAIIPLVHNKSYFRSYTGREIVLAYRQLLALPAETTVLAVQGSRAAQDEFASLPTPFIKEAHRIFKRKRFVLKGLTNEEALRVFARLDKSLVQSHVGRTLGTKLFRDKHFLGSGEILSSRRLLLLSNPTSRKAIVIKEQAITEIIYDLLDLVFEILEGRNTFDLNDHLRNKIAEL